MKLYHGSNLEVKVPRIISSDRKLDFGTGFYLTSSYEQAERWAILTTKRKGTGQASISVFNFNDTIIQKLNHISFSKPDKEWLRFVSSNRNGQSASNDYDLIIGPVANDRTMPVISLYFSGIYDEEETIKRLLPQKLNDQFAFKTEKALSALTFLEAIIK